jgi:membrane protease YdiL (CAAX protease family)
MSVQSPEEVQWRNVVIFSVLAYALAWALWAPGVVPRLGELLTFTATPQDFDDRFKVTTVLVMLTPMIAAIIMRLLVSREGLRHSLGPLRRWRYYALAAITPAVFVTIVLLLDVLSAWGRFTSGTQAPLWTVYLSSLISGVTIGAVFAFGEEYGWRGYLLPKLLPLGEFRASLLVGVILGVLAAAEALPSPPSWSGR